MSLLDFFEELAAYLEGFWASFVAWLEAALGFSL